MSINKFNEDRLDTRRQNTSVQLRSLRVFCDVVRRRSFSQAAQDHGLTQGAASQAVQHLEDYLSVQLIDRKKRPLVLTAEGEKFYDGVASLLRQFDTLVEETQGGDADVSGQATVGAIYSIGLSYLPSIQDRFRSKYPSAACETKMAHPHEVYRMVEQGVVDFGVISYPTPSRYISSIEWRDEPMILVGSPRHRLAMTGAISASALNEVGLVAFAPNLPIRMAIDKKLRSMGVSMRVVVELDNIDSVKHAAIVNSGVAFLPEPTVQNELSAGSLQAIQCDELKMTRPLAIIQRRDLPLSRAARGMLDMLLQDAQSDRHSKHEFADVQLPDGDQVMLPDSAASQKLKSVRSPK
ncbi:MAG: LysR family transcriptional regulator [Pirellulaceae bacterium]|nr:LysR family transcriptional regulator [Pirellulaceae bacterium]